MEYTMESPDFGGFTTQSYQARLIPDIRPFPWDARSARHTPRSTKERAGSVQTGRW